MKKLSMLSIILSVCLLRAASVFAAPVDLSTFSTLNPSDPVYIDTANGTVVIDEDPSLAAVYFFNDSYIVPGDATVFSFDYDFRLGPEDTDYFVFELNFSEALLVEAAGAGHFEIDMSSYQGTDVSLSWALIWNFDETTHANLTLSNINTAVPLPGTILLLGSGLTGLIYAGRKKRFIR